MPSRKAAARSQGGLAFERNGERVTQRDDIDIGDFDAYLVNVQAAHGRHVGSSGRERLTARRVEGDPPVERVLRATGFQCGACRCLPWPCPQPLDIEVRADLPMPLPADRRARPLRAEPSEPRAVGGDAGIHSDRESRWRQPDTHPAFDRSVSSRPDKSGVGESDIGVQMPRSEPDQCLSLRPGDAQPCVAFRAREMSGKFERSGNLAPVERATAGSDVAAGGREVRRGDAEAGFDRQRRGRRCGEQPHGPRPAPQIVQRDSDSPRQALSFERAGQARLDMVRPAARREHQRYLVEHAQAAVGLESGLGQVGIREASAARQGHRITTQLDRRLQFRQTQAITRIDMPATDLDGRPGREYCLEFQGAGQRPEEAYRAGRRKQCAVQRGVHVDPARGTGNAGIEAAALTDERHTAFESHPGAVAMRLE